jgi:hypothetical protein
MSNASGERRPSLRSPTGDRDTISKRNGELRMSILNERSRFNPEDPSHFAPPWLRERPDSSPSASRETTSEPFRGPTRPPASLNTRLENAVSGALWHPLDPEIIQEPPGYAAEVNRKKALMSVVSRFTAAVGVSALVALFFVFMIPAARDYAPQPDAAASTFSGILQSIKAVLYRSVQGSDDSKPALSEFQGVLASTQTGQSVMTREQSDALLQQFMHWREKPNSTAAPQ